MGFYAQDNGEIFMEKNTSRARGLSKIAKVCRIMKRIGALEQGIGSQIWPPLYAMRSWAAFFYPDASFL